MARKLDPPTGGEASVTLADMRPSRHARKAVGPRNDRELDGRMGKSFRREGSDTRRQLTVASVRGR